jgi:hypothetical protein
MNKYFFVIALATVWFLNSCGDVLNSDRNLIKTPDGEPPVLSVGSFPNTIGSLWIYQVYDGYNNLIDTVEVKIFANASPTKLQTAAVWAYNYYHDPSKNYNKFISVKDNLAIQYTSFDDSVGIKLFQFPLSLGSSWYVGHSWDSTFHADTAKVIEITNQKFNNITYTVYKIKRMFQVNAGLYTTEYIEFIPDLGILSDDKAEFFTAREKLVLIDYSIK